MNNKNIKKTTVLWIFFNIPVLQAYQEHVVSQEHVSRAARVFHLDIPSKKQLKEEGKDKEIHHCDICDVKCSGESCWIAHITGSKHKKVSKIHHYISMTHILF